jgi:effector-binding domain-containing protein
MTWSDYLARPGKVPGMYSVSIETVHPRPLAAIRVRMPLVQVPGTFARYLTPVYETARGIGLALDGQNVFIYENDDDGAADVTFGVGVKVPFRGHDPLIATQTPAGTAAHVTHWGDYSRLGDAHDAVLSWRTEQGKTLAGPRWEVYGHWSNDPAKVRTDIYWLLRD